MVVSGPTGIVPLVLLFAAALGALLVLAVRSPRGKKVRTFSLAAGLALLPLLLAGGIKTPEEGLKLREYAFKADLPRPVRIGFFSDLHTGLGLNAVTLDRITESYARLKPDAIFVGGDLVDGDADALTPVLGFFRKLTEIAPVYAVMGNTTSTRAGRRA